MLEEMPVQVVDKKYDEMIAVEAMLVGELARTKNNLNEAIKALEWLSNFVKDKTVLNIVNSTLEKIK
jgi:hypothetical protein